ncbi:uncharacterized protein LACBIDRAFT_293824 [Laccaria bicolor S238N-H82]|uniref:Predicted protein n=1 Tax=Laccaria bicolor (strain S238N-H82 / ATCC MYA-4686) TaxID=486041 RepID=B0D708_LACBS|nr:uncharacterized protein LACBIDRAFT_293824 [Laccaria bicolor S238N-H82]EDR09314.1 predicted protein [Laccaria bicolor S238N-H82]|eukprot:XP_001879663.1 predicted protein [Laccaria bicolor S238N-H82]
MVENGLYTLKASPVVEAASGGMYATGNGTFKIVTVAAQVPTTFDRQTWKITAVRGKKDTYTIIQHHKHDISLGGSWSLEDNLSVPHGPVITAEEHIEWEITPANNADTYFIQAIHKSDGHNGWFVGTDHKNEVVIIRSPIFTPPFPDRPYWQFNKSS